MSRQYLVTYEITVDADQLPEDTHAAAALHVSDLLIGGLEMGPVLTVTALIAGIQSGIPLTFDTDGGIACDPDCVSCNAGDHDECGVGCHE